MPSTVPMRADDTARSSVFGSPMVNISGSASRIAATSKNVSHNVFSVSTQVTTGRLEVGPPGPRTLARPGSVDQEALAALLAGALGTGGTLTVPLPGLKSAGTLRPG